MARAPAERKRLGAQAEDAACALLQRNGLQLLARNARYPFGEIDSIFQDGVTIVFVEVRFRRSTQFGGAAVSIDTGKRRNIALAAQAWLSAHPQWRKAACRFDVVAVSMQAQALHCDWMRAAFTLDDLGA